MENILKRKVGEKTTTSFCDGLCCENSSQPNNPISEECQSKYPFPLCPDCLCVASNRYTTDFKLKLYNDSTENSVQVQGEQLPGEIVTRILEFLGIRLAIKTLTGKTYQAFLPRGPLTTAYDLKMWIYKHHRTPIEQQRIYMRGKEVGVHGYTAPGTKVQDAENKKHLLCECGVTDGNTVHLLLHLRGAARTKQTSRKSRKRIRASPTMP
jgi:hypothetical protein